MRLDLSMSVSDRYHLSYNNLKVDTPDEFLGDSKEASVFAIKEELSYSQFNAYFMYH